MSQENLENVKAGFEAFSEVGIDGVLSLLAPDVRIVVQDEFMLGNHHGHGGARDLYRLWTEAFDDFEVTPVVFITPDDLTVVVPVLYEGRGVGSQVNTEAEFVFVFRVNEPGGLATEWGIYLTREDALQAVGLSE